MSWLISAGVMAKKGMQATSGKQGAGAPLALHGVSNPRHTSSQWSLVSHSAGLASVSQAKQIWQGVLSELVDH